MLNCEEDVLAVRVSKTERQGFRALTRTPPTTRFILRSQTILVSRSKIRVQVSKLRYCLPLLLTAFRTATKSWKMSQSELEYRSSCHCQSTILEFQTEERLEDRLSRELILCNCSICTKNGYINYYVPRCSINFIRGEHALRVGRHLPRTADRKSADLRHAGVQLHAS